MKIKQNYLKAGLGLAALALLPLCHPAMAKDQVPFRGSRGGVNSPGPFHFPFFTILNVGKGNATHLGRYTITGTLMVNVLDPETVTGTFTLISANGR